MNSVVTTIKTLKPAEHFSEMRVYTIWAYIEAYMATLGGVTEGSLTHKKGVRISKS